MATGLQALLKLMILVGAVFMIVLWVFYFCWLRPHRRRERATKLISNSQVGGNVVGDLGLAKRNVQDLKVDSQDHVASLLGLQPMRQLDWAQLITRGFPAEAFDTFVERSGLARNEALRAIAMSSQQMARRRQSGIFSCEESERLFRLAHVVSRTSVFFGDIEASLAWLQKPHPMLRGFSPLKLVRTEPGAQEVLRILTSVEYGNPV